MKAFLIWWLHDSSWGEWFVIEWLLSIAVVLFSTLGYVTFRFLLEWFEVRPHRKK